MRTRPLLSPNLTALPSSEDPEEVTHPKHCEGSGISSLLAQLIATAVDISKAFDTFSPPPPHRVDPTLPTPTQPG